MLRRCLLHQSRFYSSASPAHPAQPLHLSYQEFGAPAPSSQPAHGAPIVVVHGLYGSKRNWLSISKSLARTSQSAAPSAAPSPGPSPSTANATGDSRHVLAVDLRNHGESPHSDTMSYAAMADDLALFLDMKKLDSPVVMGHSMGGKVAMTLALRNPSRIKALVVVDIAPVDYKSKAEVHELSSIVSAMKALDLSALSSTRDADAILAKAIPNISVRQFILTNLYDANAGTGATQCRFQWRANVNVLARELPILAGFPKFERETFDKPALFLAGSRSAYVQGQDTVREVRRLFPNAQLEYLDAGHWVHSEKSAEFVQTVRRFLKDI